MEKSDLREGEKYYQRLLEAVTDYIYIVKIEHGQAVATTHGAGCVVVTGYTPSEYEADPGLWYRMVHEADREAILEQIARVLSGEDGVFLEHRILHKDGSIRWVRNTLVPCYSEQAQLITYDGLIVDITERKQAEVERECLLKAEREQRLLAETLGEVFLALTSQTSPEAVLDQILQQMQRIVSYSAANIVLLEDNRLRIVRWQGYQIFGGEKLLANLEQLLDNFPLDAAVVQSQQPLIVPDTQQDLRWTRVTETAWIRSFMVVPICLHHRVLGLLRLDSNVPQAFSGQDIERLRPLANAAAIALENARLYDQARQELAERKRVETEIIQRNSELLALQYAGAAVASSLDLQYILNTVTREMATLLSTQGCAILEWHQIKNTVAVVAKYHSDKWRKDGWLDQVYSLADFPLMKQVLIERRAQQMTVRQAGVDLAQLAYMQRVNIKTLLMLPMESQDHIVGLVEIVDSQDERIFTNGEVALVQLLANQAASAIKNAQLYSLAQREITRRKQAEMKLRVRVSQQATVAELGQRALTETNLAMLMDEAVVLLAQALSVDYCKVLELQPDGMAFLLRAGVGWQDGLVGQAIVDARTNSQAYYTLFSREPVIVKDLRTETRFSGPPVLHDHGVISGISVIIHGQERPFGILGAHTIKQRIFTKDDVHFLQAVANVLAAAIERKRAEEALQESEIKFRTLAETTAAAIFIYQDVQNRYVNPATEAVTGYTQGELLAMNFWEMIHPDFQELVKSRGVARQQGESIPSRYELKILTKNGEERWLDFTGGLIEFQGRTAVLGTAFDITERKRMEEALKKSEAKLRAIFDNSLQAFILIDLDHKIQAFNKVANEVIKLTLGSELKEGSSIYDLMFEADVDEFNRHFNRALKGEPVRVEKSINIGGVDNWFEFHYDPVFANEGQVIGVCFSTVNIDERKRAADTLAESEARLLTEMRSVLAITRALVSKINLDNLLEFIMAQAEHLMNADGAVVLLLNDNHQQFEVATPGESWLPIKPGSRLPVQGSLAMLAIAHQRVQISNRAQEDDRTASIRALLQPAEIRSLLCAPLRAQNKGLGVLLIWSEREQNFTAHNGRLMSLFADQAALALHNAHLHARNRQLAIERERHRLARALHDSVTQSLYSIGLAAQTSLRQLGQDAASSVREPIEYIHILSQTALTEIREELYHLHPTVLNEDLVKALTQHCNMLSRQYALVIEFKSDLEVFLSIHQRNALYYITREALWNVVKHANATHVNLTLISEGDQILVTIEDNGIGFDPSAFTGGETMGLRNIEERTKPLGGTFELQSKPGQGTKLTVRIPARSDSE